MVKRRSAERQVLWELHTPGGEENSVPGLAIEDEIGGAGGEADVAGIGAADDGDHFARMSEKPGEGDGGAVGLVVARGLIEGREDLLVMGKVRGGGVRNVACGDATLSERTPGHGGDVFLQALVEGAIGEDVEKERVDLDLVDLEGKIEGALDQGKQAGAKITDPKFADFAGGAKFGEGPSDILRIGEEVGPVEHEEIDGVDAQAGEGLFDGRDDMGGGKIVPVREAEGRLVLEADAAFCRARWDGG